jgi:hypothetical protein
MKTVVKERVCETGGFWIAISFPCVIQTMATCWHAPASGDPERITTDEA